MFGERGWGQGVVSGKGGTGYDSGWVGLRWEAVVSSVREHLQQ